ncbi:nitrate reductase associated protein [Phormidium sp. CCY1219]|nr:nitrate reductase associated protein [Phormidium sp. CCY1219]
MNAEIVSRFPCILIQVRYKSDTCGVQLKPSHSNQFRSRNPPSMNRVP